MNRIARLSPLLIVAALAGCGGSSDYRPQVGQEAAAIFAEACAGCHGEGGSGKFGFLLAVAGSDAAPEAIAAHIAEGGPVMPAFPNIGEAERLALADYLKSR